MPVERTENVGPTFDGRPNDPVIVRIAESRTDRLIIFEGHQFAVLSKVRHKLANLVIRHSPARLQAWIPKNAADFFEDEIRHEQNVGSSLEPVEQFVRRPVGADVRPDQDIRVKDNSHGFGCGRT